MKRNGSYLRQYLPWLGLLLGVDALAALLLWLADARAFAAMTVVIVLATVFLFAGVCAVLCARSKRREQAFTAFLTTPDAVHEQALCRLLSPAESRSTHLLGETLRAQQQTIAQLQTQMDDYEDYVELWAHEVKTPLALLTLVLDNRRDTLPEAVGFKLDYVRNRMQAFIDQMLYYARLRGATTASSGWRCAAASTRCSTITARCWRKNTSGSSSGLRTRPYSPTGAGCVSCSDNS